MKMRSKKTGRGTSNNARKSFRNTIFSFPVENNFSLRLALRDLWLLPPYGRFLFMNCCGSHLADQCWIDCSWQVFVNSNIPKFIQWVVTIIEFIFLPDKLPLHIFKYILRWRIISRFIDNIARPAVIEVLWFDTEII